jgi:hypothetical protein
MASIARSLGQFGSDVSTGQDIAQDYRARAQQMQMAAARQKLADLLGPLQVAELQQRLRQQQNPQPSGIERGPTGAISGVTWNPNTGKYELQSLAPGQAVPPKITTPFEAWRAQNPDAPLSQWFKDSQRTPEAKDPFEVWRAQNPNASVADWLKLQEKYKKPAGGEGGIKTPFELWKNNNPKGTYEQWIQSSKQEDRGDATKAVTAVMNAQKALQSLEVGVQKTNRQFSVWNPNTYGNDPALAAITKQATDDFEAKRQDAVAKLTDAGMPVPEWLTRPMGGNGNVPPPTAPPPPGFVPNK